MRGMRMSAFVVGIGLMIVGILIGGGGGTLWAQTPLYPIDSNTTDQSGGGAAFQASLYTGAATYSIPIQIPPGTGGMQPNIALVYSSDQSEDGWLGPNWTLAGLGAIERDTRRGVPKYDGSQNNPSSGSDRFLLDLGGGRDLIYTGVDPTGRSGNYYRLKNEAAGQVWRVEFFPRTHPTAGFQTVYWVVTRENGVQYRFGYDAGANVIAVGKSATRAWLLDRVIDPHGNSMEFAYEQDSANGDVYPTTITYTKGNGLAAFRTVTFTRALRPDPFISYRTGSKMKMDKRITKIETKVGTALFRRYLLLYEQSPDTGRTRLKSVQEVGADGVTTLPPTTFTYTDRPTFGAPSTWPGTAALGPLQGSAGIGNVEDILDINGDGRLDKLKAIVDPVDSGNSRWEVAKNTGSGFQPYVPWPGTAHIKALAEVTTAEIDAPPLNEKDYSWWELIDLDGDGRLDKIGTTINPPGFTYFWNFSPNVGSGFGGNNSTWFTSTDERFLYPHYTEGEGPDDQHTVLRRQKRSLIDLNGDGLPDRVAANEFDWSVAFNNGSGFGTWTNWSGADGRHVVTDFTETPKYITTSSTSFGICIGPFCYTWSNASVEFSCSPCPFYSDEVLADLNGDGLPDRVVKQADNSWAVGLNTGSGFAPLSLWPGSTGMGSIRKGNTDYDLVSLSGCSGLRTQSYTADDLIDINGDSLPDRVWVSSGQLYAAFNSGNSFSAATSLGISSDAVRYVEGLPPRCEDDPNSPTTKTLKGWFDLNGDGVPDWVTVGSDGWTVKPTQGMASNLLREVKNPFGGKSTFTYTPSTAYDNTGADGQPHLPFVRWVLSQAAHSDGLGLTSTTNYGYKGGEWVGRLTREFRGFAEVTVTEPGDHNGDRHYSVTTFHQDDARKGKVDKIRSYTSAGSLFKETGYTYATGSPSAEVTRVDLTSESIKTYDGEVAPKELRTDYASLDLYGQPRSITYSGSDIKSRTASIDFVYNTSLYLLNRTSHRSSAAEGIKFQESWFSYDGLSNNVAPTKGDLTKEENWLFGGTNQVVQYSYDAFGNRVGLIDAVGNRCAGTGLTTKIDYDSTYRTFPVTETNAACLSTVKSYWGIDTTLSAANVAGAYAVPGFLATLTDFNNVRSDFYWDVLGRPKATVVPPDTDAVPTTLWSYSVTGTAPNRVTESKRESTGGGTIDHFTYTDGLGRTVQTKREAETSGQWITQDTFYNNRNLVERASVPYFTLTSAVTSLDSSRPKTTTHYDALKRVVKVILPDNTFHTLGYQTGKITREAQMDPDQWTKTTHTYDALGRLTKVEEYLYNNPAKDVSRPTVSISSPKTGSLLSGTITISVNASDNIGVQRVELYVDGAIIATDVQPPYTFVWDTLKAEEKTYSLYAKAYDFSGNTSTSSTITVSVLNFETNLFTGSLTYREPIGVESCPDVKGGPTTRTITLNNDGRIDATATIALLPNAVKYNVRLELSQGGVVLAAGGPTDLTGINNKTASISYLSGKKGVTYTLTVSGFQRISPGFTKYEETSSSIKYTGTWSSGSFIEAGSSKSYKFTSGVGAKATFSFYGTSFRIAGVQAVWDTSGKAVLKLDGSVEDVAFKDEWLIGSANYPFYFYSGRDSATIPSLGTHTIEILRDLGQINIDYIEVANCNPTNAGYTLTATYPQTSPVGAGGVGGGEGTPPQAPPSGYTLSGTTKISYDNFDLNGQRREMIIDAAENVTEIVFDTLNRKVRQNDPDLGVYSFVYDGNGNLLTQTDEVDGQVITSTYDPLNRIKTKRFSNGSPDLVKPTPPSGLTATAKSTNAINLAWNPGTDNTRIEQYLLERCQGAGCGSDPNNFSQIATVAATASLGYSDTGLADDTSYSYRVRSMDVGRNVSDTYSNIATAKTFPAPPTSLNVVDVPADQGGALQLTWIPSSSGSITQQWIYRSFDDRRAGSQRIELIAKINNNTTSSYIDTGLTDGVTYTYFIRAYNGVVFSDDSNEVSGIPLDNLAPNPPSGLTASDVPGDTGGAIQLTWTPSTSADVREQRIYQTLTSQGPYMLVETLSGNTRNNQSISRLNDGTTYYYVIRAFDGTNESGDSNEASATPVDNSRPDLAMTAVEGSSTVTTGGSIDLSYTVVNQSTVPTDTSFRIRFYLSLDSKISADDIVLGDRQVNQLAGGQSESRTISMTVPTTASEGSYRLIAFADQSDTIREGNEQNNTFASDRLVHLLTAQHRQPTTTLQMDAGWKSVGCGNAHTCLDDPIGNYNTTTYIERSGSSGQYAVVGFPAFTLPSDVTVDYVRVTYVAKDGSATPPDVNAVLRVGGSHSLSGAKAMTGSWSVYSEDWGLNPKTNLPWTVADVNGTGANPLQGMGVSSVENTPQVTQVYISVGYHKFSTCALPAVESRPAVGTTSAQASLNGTVNPNGCATSVWFEWGLTSAYGNTTPVQNMGSGIAELSFSQTVTGLTGNTIYHFRTVAQNSMGTVYGGDLWFATYGAVTQDRLPNSDLLIRGAWNTTGCGSSSAYLCVDDPIGSPNNGTDSLSVRNRPGKEAVFGFPAFSIPSGVTVEYVRVTYVAVANAAPADLKAMLQVGGSYYTQPTPQLLSSAWTTYSYDWSFNPKTGKAWTVAEMNGGGLQGIGLYSGNGDLSVTQVYATVGYQAVSPCLLSSVSTDPAVDLSSTRATLKGAVNPGGCASMARFEWGVTPEFGNTTPDQNVGSGAESVAISEVLTGLAANTTYYYRAVLQNSEGTFFGETRNLITLSEPPIVGTGSATAIGPNSVTLHGTVNPNGDSASVWYEYGVSTAYGFISSVQGVSGSTAADVPIAVSQLAELTTYHFRVVAENRGGISYGADATFTTTARPPVVTTEAPSSVSQISATLNGTANPNGVSGTAWFEYGTSSGIYDSSTPPQAISGSAAVSVSVQLSNLKGGNNYYYRIAAENNGGRSYGTQGTFQTLPNGKILYSISANTTPRVRDYTDSPNPPTNPFFSAAATTVAGGTAIQTVLRASPTKNEYIAGYVNSSGVLQILCFNGSTWTNQWSVTVGGTGTTRRFDIAYETHSGDVIVLYSRNTAAANALAFRTKAGSAACGSTGWSAATNLSLNSTVTSGVVHWVKLAWDRRPTSNLIAAIWADGTSTPDLGAAVWSGTGWGGQKILETSLQVVSAAQDVENFDAEYESLSGDLMVVWGRAVTSGNGARYMTCTGGTATCTWSSTAVTMPNWLDDATHLDLGANPNTDEFVFASIGKNGTTSRLQAGYWNGSSWSNPTTAVDSSVTKPTAGTQFVAAGWLINGSVTRSIVTYYDASATNIGWVVGNGGTFATQSDFTPTPAFGAQRQYNIQIDPFNKDRLMFTVSDANADLFAKRLVMSSTAALTWTHVDGGAALEANTASSTYKTFDFAYGR